MKLSGVGFVLKFSKNKEERLSNAMTKLGHFWISSNV